MCFRIVITGQSRIKDIMIMKRKSFPIVVSFVVDLSDDPNNKNNNLVVDVVAHKPL